jgi:tight adherence protein B
VVWRAWLPVAVVGPVLAALVLGPGGAVLALAALVGAPWLAWWAMRGRGDRRLEADLPACLEAVARALRSGASLPMALTEATQAATGRLAADLAQVQADVGVGQPLVAALERWPERRPLAGVRLCVAALCLGAETGGAQAAAVDGVAATMRQRLASQAEAAALAAQARLSAWVIGLAPVGFGLLASAADSRHATFLFRTPVGLVVLLAGLALDGAGAVWMMRLARVPS